jgi:HD-like signal output (HDOD) protein
MAAIAAPAPAPPTVLVRLEGALVARLRANRVRIPPYPAVAARLQKVVSSPKHSVAEVVAVVASDPTLAAAVLARACTAAASAGQRATTLDAAVQRLGADELQRIALATSLGTAATAPGPLAALRRDAWRRALLGARIAHELAGPRNLAPDEAFAAGLLHDFGEVVVIACIEQIGTEYELPVLPADAWRELVHKLHLEFGVVVAARWNLPRAIADAIAHHHDAPDATAPLVQLVAMIDRAVAILDRSPNTGVAALLEVTGLASGERYKIASVLPQVVEQMAELEATPLAPTTSKIAREPAAAEDWPVEFDVIKGTQPYRACRLSPDSLTFFGAAPLTPNWLVQLQLHLEREALDMLANIASCERQPDGSYLITARPFALGGPIKAAWLKLLDGTRPRR